MRSSQRRDAAGWPSLPAPLLRQGFLSRCADTPRSPSQRLRKRSIQPIPRQARPGFRLPHQTSVCPEAALSRRQLVFTILRPVTAVERAHFRLRSDFGGSAGTTATRTLSGRHGNLTGGFRIQRRPPFLSGLLQYFKPRKRGGRNAAPPYPEKHQGKPLRDKKDCREKKRTAEEKESLLAGRGGNNNGTRKAAGGEKRTAEEKRKFAGGKRRKQQRDKKGHRRKKREPQKKKKVCWWEEEETATGQKRPPEKKREPPKNEKTGR